MFDAIRAFSRRFREKNETLWQLVVFWLLGGVATVVDLAVFSTCNYWLFAPLRNTAFHWWLLDYPPAGGGLCAFLAMACSFAISQAVNFVVQRRETFRASNNVAFSAALYAVMVVAVYFFVLWAPTLYLTRLYAAVGQGWGAILSKLFTQFLSFLIQFPINKWVIMR